MTDKRFYNFCDGFEGFLIEDKKEEVLFKVPDKQEADDITDFLNKQDEIIRTLQKEDSINSVEIIEMRQELDRMIKFHERFKHERAINNIMWDCLTKLRRKWFND